MIKINGDIMTKIQRRDSSQEPAKTLYFIRRGDFDPNTELTDLVYADLNSSDWYTTGTNENDQYIQQNETGASQFIVSRGTTSQGLGSILLRLKLYKNGWGLTETKPLKSYLNFYSADINVQIGSSSVTIQKVEISLRYDSTYNKYYCDIYMGNNPDTELNLKIRTYELTSNSFIDGGYVVLYLYASVLTNPTKTDSKSLPEFCLGVCSRMDVANSADKSWYLIYPTNSGGVITKTVLFDKNINSYPTVGFQCKYINSEIDYTYFSISTKFNRRNITYPDGNTHLLYQNDSSGTKSYPMSKKVPYTNGNEDTLPDLNKFNMPTV